MANVLEAYESAADLQDGNYDGDFDPECYLQMYYGNPIGPLEGGFLKFALDGLHAAFHTGAIKGNRLLDIGSGPSFHTVISASPYVNEIYFSDYVEKSRQILASWWKEGKTYEQHLHPLRYVMELENKGQTAEDRSSNIRNKVKNIVPIDVTSSSPLQAKDVPKSYDVITSSLCLESPIPTVEGYEQNLKNISPLLKKGGYLVIVGVLNEDMYPVGKFKFMCTKITKEEIRDIYARNGFQIVSLETFKNSEFRYGVKKGSEDFEIEFVMVAEKQ